ncbi:MAG: Gfo/Idh/MocA family oxidoreductase [Lactobacillaceae bacterium]|jgi:predicted dehydrogenase|nr:Gfo/Idh/MocA family oxidoreductase [Lactobacillaceae bacterium]
MINLGIVGTSWITAQFAEAAQKTGQFQVVGLLSRNSQKGEAFLRDNKIETAAVFSDLGSLLAQVDAIYLGSPNSLHYAQAKMAIENNVDIIVEKPVVSNPTEFEDLMATLKVHPNVRLVEAARHVFSPNFAEVKNAIANLDEIQGANLVYAKYSSRYDDYLNPQTPTPNVFSLEYSGGALYDLGVYTIYAALGWFGMPEKSQYVPNILENGVDGSGWILLEYPDFKVNIFMGKTLTSNNYSEIYGGKNTIRIDSVSELNNIHLNDQLISHDEFENPLSYEAEVFAKIFQDKTDVSEYLRLQELSKQVNQVMFDLRQSANITFPADNK